jgi:hypothetical protein
VDTEEDEVGVRKMKWGRRRGGEKERWMNAIPHTQLSSSLSLSLHQLQAKSKRVISPVEISIQRHDAELPIHDLRAPRDVTSR